MTEETARLSAQVPTKRLRRAEKILHKLGLTPAEAINIFLAQVEIRRGLPFDVSIEPKPMLTAGEQAAVWTEAFGAY